MSDATENSTSERDYNDFRLRLTSLAELSLSTDICLEPVPISRSFKRFILDIKHTLDQRWYETSEGFYYDSEFGTVRMVVTP